MRRIVVGGVATLGLAWAGVSDAHGPSHQRGYVSTVLYVQPAVPGLTATVLGGDQLLSIRNWTNRTLVVLDAHGRPAYRLGADRISRRVGTTWSLMKRGSSYTWHDPRIHWQGADPPDVVEQAPDEIHRIAAWRVPGTLDGRRVVIHGSLGWGARASSDTAELRDRHRRFDRDRPYARGRCRGRRLRALGDATPNARAVGRRPHRVRWGLRRALPTE